MARDIISDQEARQKLQAGIHKLANAVKSTLGPKGHNVMIENSFGSPRVTKDGVTVAREIDLEDRWENMGAQLLKGAAEQAMDEAGDGTTTAIVLAEAIVDEGIKVVAAGNSPIGIRDGINRAVRAVREELLKHTKRIKGIEDIKTVATVAANGDEKIGTLIADALEMVGEMGYVTVEKGRGSETKIESHKGMMIEKGFASPHFITDGSTYSCLLDTPLIFISRDNIRMPQQVVPLMQYAAMKNKALVVIAPSVEGAALSTLVVNKLQGALSTVAVNLPSFGDETFDVANDIATVIGSEVFDTKAGHTLEDLTDTPDRFLGTTNEDGYVLSDKDKTLIIGGNGEQEDIDTRVSGILDQVDTALSPYKKELLLKRAAKLRGGIAKISAGGHSEAEVKELFDRIDDALCAARAASVFGVLPGGGVALIKAKKVLDTLEVKREEEKIGINIVRRALSSPLHQIAANAGEDGKVIEMRILEKEGAAYDYGWDAADDKYVNMYEAGIIDPAKVTITALETAASVAVLVLTTNVTVANIPTEGQFSAIGPGRPR